jgi:undecaprenyl-diphosphatase
MGGIRHPAAVALAAAAGLVSSWILATLDPIRQWEPDVTEWLAGTPDPFAWMLYPNMVMGTIGGGLVISFVIGVFGRDRLLALTMAASLAVTWLLARVVKRVVDRPRPSAYLPEIDVRDLVGADLGYASGHSAIAATWGVMAMAALPPGWRWFGPFCALLVGLARVVHGVHLPADVIGGWSIGTLVALGGLAAFDTFDRVRH